MDIGIDLIESYLRLCGYLTLAEFEIARPDESGTFRTLTDVDVMAVRFPAVVPSGQAASDLLLIDDPELRLDPGCIDVVIGEVKQGEARLNPGITDRAVLVPLLRRVEWLYGSPLDDVVAELEDSGLAIQPDRSGGATVRTRLMAFGRSPVNDLHTLSLHHVVDTLLRFFAEHEAAVRPIQFRDPAPAMLRLLLKAGFEFAPR